MNKLWISKLKLVNSGKHFLYIVYLSQTRLHMLLIVLCRWRRNLAFWPGIDMWRTGPCSCLWTKHETQSSNLGPFIGMWAFFSGLHFQLAVYTTDGVRQTACYEMFFISGLLWHIKMWFSCAFNSLTQKHVQCKWMSWRVTASKLVILMKM